MKINPQTKSLHFKKRAKSNVSCDVGANTDSKKIEEILTRNVDQVLPDKNQLKRLMQQRKIRLYLGVDPTGRKLHLGHTILFRKLQEFADLGHKAVLVIGTGTVLTGDPSQREKARVRISQKEIEENIKTWKKQVSKILDFTKIKIKYNGDWLLKLRLKEIINIASQISAVRLFQRDIFQKRIKKGETVWTHEILYPLLQGYDSVVMDTDLEIGGTDQIFNMLIGRELQRKMNNKEKFVLTCPMLLGTDGNPMSKSSGNCIWIEDSAKQMFGKIMSIPDKLIIPYFEFLTDVSSRLLQKYKKDIQLKRVNPKNLKTQLAFEVVKMYHSERAAKEVGEEFDKIFRERKLPSKIRSAIIKDKFLDTCSLLTKTKLAPSKSEAKRLIFQGGVKIDGKVKKDWKEKIKIKRGQIIQVGKRKFVKIG